MSREAAVLLAKKLKALADHKETPGPEADSAREKLGALKRQWGLSDAELIEEPGIGEVGPWIGWSQVAQTVINPDGTLNLENLEQALDDLPDETMKQGLKIAIGVFRLVSSLER